jgi:hypothetical protein
MGVTPFTSEPPEASTESTTLRTGISYAAALSGKAEVGDEKKQEKDSTTLSNSGFDNINLNDDAGAGTC